MRHLWVTAILLCSTLVQAATVNDIRLWTAPDHTRLVLDLSDRVKYRVFTLRNPERVVIDIDNTRLSTRTSLPTLAGSGITSIRTGVQEKINLRVVLDLHRKLTPRSFIARPNKQYGNRLVVDLRRSKQQKESTKAAHRNNRSKGSSSTDKRDFIVAIDAGHGGEDPGAIGPRKSKEKHVVLAIAKELERLLEKEPHFRPLMIRKGDYYIPLKKRRDIARKNNADLFISIHADAFLRARAHGASVYAVSLEGATTAMAAYLANTENAVDSIGGIRFEDKDDDLKDMLLDIMITGTLISSLKLGDDVLKHMGRVVKLHRHQVEQAGFAVLKSPNMPSILVETGFISNPREELNLGSRNYRQKLAKQIFLGIKRYGEYNPPPDTWLAWRKNQTMDFISYEVVHGDTLSGIAQKHSTSVAQIRALNKLKGNTILIGQVLKLPRV